MKEKINSIQLSSLFTLLILSSTIGLSSYPTIKIAGLDSYISIGLGSILGIIPLILLIYISNYEIDKPIYEKNEIIFGKIFGNIINFILTAIFFVMAATVLFNSCNFLISQYLSETPLIIAFIVFGLVVVYAVNKGIETISRVGSIFLVITLFFFITGIFGLIGYVKLDNIKPILEFGIKKPLWGAFINVLVSTSPIYAILVFPKNNLTDKEKLSKTLIIQYIIAEIIKIAISFTSTSILGQYLLKLYQYPVYIALKRLSIFGFIDRIENFISIQWVLSNFITLAMLLYYIKANIQRKKNSKILNTLIMALVIIFSYYVFKNNTTFNYCVYKYYPIILMVLFGIIIIISISIFIKKRIKKVYKKEKIKHNTNRANA